MATITMTSEAFRRTFGYPPTSAVDEDEQGSRRPQSVLETESKDAGLKMGAFDYTPRNSTSEPATPTEAVGVGFALTPPTTPKQHDNKTNFSHPLRLSLDAVLAESPAPPLLPQRHPRHTLLKEQATPPVSPVTSPLDALNRKIEKGQNLLPAVNAALASLNGEELGSAMSRGPSMASSPSTLPPEAEADEDDDAITDFDSDEEDSFQLLTARVSLFGAISPSPAQDIHRSRANSHGDVRAIGPNIDGEHPRQIYIASPTFTPRRLSVAPPPAISAVPDLVHDSSAACSPADRTNTWSWPSQPSTPSLAPSPTPEIEDKSSLSSISEPRIGDHASFEASIQKTIAQCLAVLKEAEDNSIARIRRADGELTRMLSDPGAKPAVPVRSNRITALRSTALRSGMTVDSVLSRSASDGARSPALRTNSTDSNVLIHGRRGYASPPPPQQDVSLPPPIPKRMGVPPLDLSRANSIKREKEKERRTGTVDGSYYLNSPALTSPTSPTFVLSTSPTDTSKRTPSSSGDYSHTALVADYWAERERVKRASSALSSPLQDPSPGFQAAVEEIWDECEGSGDSGEEDEEQGKRPYFFDNDQLDAVNAYVYGWEKPTVALAGGGRETWFEE